MKKDIIVGAAVMRAVLGDIKGNLARMADLVEEAIRRHVDILCFPELNVTGYGVKKEIMHKIAVKQNGPVVAAILHMAQSSGLTILAGFAEKSGKYIYASHIVAGPDGQNGIYHKIHPGPPEAKVFSGGTSVELFSGADTRFGIQLCYDAHFPELSTLYALNGADVIFIPHASPRGTPQKKIESWLRHLTARAFDNGVFVVASNLVGDNGYGLSFPGVAVILNPAGKVMASAVNDSNAILTAVLRRSELAEVREHRMRYFLPNRRPELYQGLVKANQNRLS